MHNFIQHFTKTVSYSYNYALKFGTRCTEQTMYSVVQKPHDTAFPFSSLKFEVTFATLCTYVKRNFVRNTDIVI